MAPLRLLLLSLLARAAAASAASLEQPAGEATCAAGEACTRGDVLLQMGQARGPAKVQGQDEPDDGKASKTAADDVSTTVEVIKTPEGVIIDRDGTKTTTPAPLDTKKPDPPSASGLVEVEQHAHHVQGIVSEQAYKRGPSFEPPPRPEEIDAFVQTIAAKQGGRPNQQEIDVFNLLVQLRARGFTCPNGQSFAPNSNLFVFDCRLWKAAQYHAQDMINRNFFGHVNPDGKDPCARSLMYGNLQGCSENIAAGQNSAVAVMEAWKGSRNHCPNMMDPALNRFGAGYAFGANSEYKHYWGQSMGTDTGHVDTSCNPPGAGTYPNPAPTPGDDCKDFHSACSSYQGYAGSPSCAGSWPSSQCKKTCGYCSSAPSPTPPTPAPPSPSPSPSPSPAPGGGGGSCVDQDPVNCRPYNGYAGSPYCNVAWTVANCRKTCGLCSSTGVPSPSPSPPTTPAPQVCTDAAGNQCNAYSSNLGSYCTYAWLQQNCAKTCGFCGR